MRGWRGFARACAGGRGLDCSKAAVLYSPRYPVNARPVALYNQRPVAARVLLCHPPGRAPEKSGPNPILPLHRIPYRGKTAASIPAENPSCLGLKSRSGSRHRAAKVLDPARMTGTASVGVGSCRAPRRAAGKSGSQPPPGVAGGPIPPNLPATEGRSRPAFLPLAKFARRYQAPAAVPVLMAATAGCAPCGTRTAGLVHIASTPRLDRCSSGRCGERRLWSR